MRVVRAAVLAVLLLAACSAARPLSLSEVRGFCNTAGGVGNGGAEDSGGGSCLEQLEICSRFFDPLAGNATDRESCLAHCRAVHAEYYHIHIMDDCRLGLTQANDLCEEYCRGNFR